MSATVSSLTTTTSTTTRERHGMEMEADERLVESFASTTFCEARQRAN